MLDERKTAILRAVVEEYIATAQPVGSAHIANSTQFAVSSATVRNDMAALEREGYLTHPHTSAGRIPTDKGYRRFVDNLVPNSTLGTIEQTKVVDFFDKAHFRLEDFLQRTSRLLTHLTNYASVVIGPAGDVAVVRSVQLVRLSFHHMTAVVVLSNGVVESQQIEISNEILDSDISEANTKLQKLMFNKPLSNVHNFRKITITENKSEAALCEKVLQALDTDRNDGTLFVGGAAQMAEAFDAVEIVRSVLHTLEQQFVVVSLVRDMLSRGLNVAIGAEHGVAQLANCSVVLAPVVAGGEPVATIGILGPTRMNYPQALATVELVSDRLGRRLTEG